MVAESEPASDGAVPREVAAAAFDRVRAAIGVCSLADGQFLYGNEACRRALGTEGMANVGYRPFWSPAKLSTIRSRLAAEGSLMGVPVQVEHPHRGARQMMASVTAIDVGGEQCALVSFLDITDLREAAVALRESEERFRQLAESLDEVFVLWAVQPTEVLYMSPSVEQIFGVPRDSTDLPGLLARVHPDDLGELSERIAGVERSRPVVADFRIVRPDGEIRWIRSRTASVAPPASDAGQTRRSTTLTDITDQKVAEEALVGARAEADRSNEAKNTFLSRMSHELRTPLNAVLGFGELLRMDDLDIVQRDHVDHILQAGRHLLGLIDEVLDITRIESGVLRLSLEAVAVADLVHEATMLIGPVAEVAAVRVTQDSIDPHIHVRADRLRLRQVLLNLVSNGVKYSSAGGRMHVSLSSDDQATVRLVVEDSGVGISPDSMSRLFQPFERLGAENTSVQGTGLGLALARQLMSLMGGTIGVDSEPGIGSRFWIELERAAAPDDVLAGPVPAEPATATEKSTTMTVLLVEDNASNIKLIEQILRRRPEVRLLVVTNGAQALAAVHDDPPDLVLLDMHLPDTSGQAVLVRIKTDPRTTSIPVVVVSADATETQHGAALDAGAADYITKPIDVARFLRTIDRILRSDGPPRIN